MDFRWHQVETFLTVARYSSFASAAADLYVTSPALIQQMNTFEKELGFKVFVRGHEGIALTDAGRCLYERMLVFADELERTVAECRSVARQGGVVRVGKYGDWAAEYLEHGTNLAFAEAYPAITVKYVPTLRDTVLQDCLCRKIDVAQFHSQEAALEAGLDYVVGTAMNLSVVMNASSRLAALPSIRPADLDGEKVLVDSDHYSDVISEWLGGGAGNAEVERTHIDLRMLVRRCAEGCVALFPSSCVGMLYPLVSRPLNPPVDYEGAYVCRKDASEAARAYIQFMLGQAESL